MRQPPPARPRIQRRWLIIGGILFVLFVFGSTIIRFYTDLLWFDELGFKSIFLKILSTRAVVGAVGGLVAGILVLLSLEIARRTAPRYRFVTAGNDIAEQYRSAYRPYARLANYGVSAVVAVFTGLSTSAMWDRYLLWRNAVPFGVEAPAPFGKDVSFYVFTIPFQRSVLSWLFGIAIASLFLSVLAHLLNGSISPESNRLQISTAVKVHVSAILAVIALLKAWAYWLDRYDLVFSSRGVVHGASYTDVKAQVPALWLLMIIAALATLILLVNVVRFRGWLLPGAAVGIWIFTSVVAGAVVPAIVQRFQVKPNESTREAPYIEHNIAATRSSFGLDRITVRNFTPQPELSEEDVANNRGTIDNVRVWDPEVLRPIYQRRQALRSYYEFDDVDVDRYELDGELRQIMLSGREVDPTELEAGAQNWVNTKLQYTHGYGLVANASNSVTSEGLPQLLVRDVPPRGEESLIPEQPRIYFGQRMASGDYAVVNTGQEEIDYPRGDEGTERFTYNGEGGIPLNNIFRRVAFALRFSDTDLALSGFIERDSRLMMRRNIMDRISTAAPFLHFDRDPYLVVADERLVWVIDAYTSTDRFPYAQRVNLEEVVPGGNLRGRSNYIRNSVKVTVDAFDGTTNYYLVEGSSDPLAETYQRAFPNLFVDGRRMPADLKQHQRYPEDMFTVQASQYRLYHMTEPDQFYSREDAWDVPVDPASEGETQAPMDPYYVVMKLPWEQEEEFLLMLPFQPRGRPTLNGWVAARMDSGHYGELVALSFPRDTNVDSPQNVERRINQNDDISEQFTLWSRAGSRVDPGPIFVIPVERTLMYVQPIYLTGLRQETALPELRRVIVVIGDDIGFEPTLEESLEAALEGRGPTAQDEDPPREEPADEEPAPPSGDDVASLLAEAQQHFERAEAALREGDLATYQREVEAAQAAVEQAQSEAG